MSSRPGELVLDPTCGTNPLAEAVRHLDEPRRWLAWDVHTEAEIQQQITDRRWEEAGGTGAEARAEPPAPAVGLGRWADVA